MDNEINLDHVQVEDVNEKALQYLQNVPTETVPEGVKFDGITCVDCGLEIEPERLAFVKGTCRCGECKYWKDKEDAQAALHGKPDYDSDV